LTPKCGRAVCSGRIADDKCNEVCRGSTYKERILDTLQTEEETHEILCFTQ